jgi:hypothetical protein
MNGAFNPVVIAQAVARNIVPPGRHTGLSLVDGNVLILYLFDTLLSMAVIISGLASTFVSRRTTKASAAGSTRKRAM